MSILADLEKFLLEEVAVDTSRKSLEPEDDLLEQGVIDSMGILKLVAYIEETYGVQIDDEDVIPENFQTLASMASFIERKTRGK